MVRHNCFRGVLFIPLGGHRTLVVTRFLILRDHGLIFGHPCVFCRGRFWCYQDSWTVGGSVIQCNECITLCNSVTGVGKSRARRVQFWEFRPTYPRWSASQPESDPRLFEKPARIQINPQDIFNCFLFFYRELGFAL